MKKVKALLFSAIAAFGLSSCSFQDVMDSVKGVFVKDKKEEHSHTFSEEWTKDENYHWHAATCEHEDQVSGKAEHEFGNDNVCDVCGYSKEPAVCTHVDADKDHACDLCGKTVGEHKDADVDGKCDYCGKDIPLVKSVTIKNAPVSVEVGEKVTLEAEVDAVGGASTSYYWTVSDSSIASIDINGNFVGLKAGQVIVTAKSVADPLKAKAVAIKVTHEQQGIKEIRILNLPEEIGIGEWALLDAKVTYYGDDHTEEFKWQVVTEEGFGRVQLDTDSDGTWILGVEEGLVEIRATSVSDPTVFGSAFINVVDNGPEPWLVSQAGLGYYKENPTDILKAYVGEGEYTMFEVPQEVYENGYYVIPLSINNNIVGAELVFNIGTYFATEEQYALGYQLMGALDSDENLYYFCDVLNDNINCYLDSTKTYEIDSVVFGPGYEDIINDYYFALQVCNTSLLYAGDDLTEDEEWPEELAQAMVDIIGEELPFFKLGASYEYQITETDSEEEMILIMDYSTHHEVTDELGSLLELNGYKFVESAYEYQKQFGSNPLKSISIQSYFTSYGNVIAIFIDDTVFEQFPDDLVNNYVSTVLESENVVPGFSLSSEELVNFRFYPEEVDYYTGEAYASITGLYANYDEFLSYLDELLSYDYTFTNVSYYESNNPVHICNVEAELGKILLKVSCEPQVIIDWDTFTIETDWDSSTICVDIYNSGRPEEVGVTFINNDLSLRIEDETYVQAVGYELEGATIEYSSNDPTIASVDENGKVVALAKGTTTITASANVGGQVYTDTIDVIVNYKVLDDIIMFCDCDMSNLSNVVSENGTVMSFSKADAEEDLAYNEGYLYLPEGATFTVTADSDHLMSFIEFGAGEGSSAEFVPDQGQVVKGAWYADEDSGTVNSVTFTVTTGGYYYGMAVTLDGDLEEIPSSFTIMDVVTDFIEWNEYSIISIDDQSYYDYGYIDIYIYYDLGMAADEWLIDGYTLTNVLEDNFWAVEYCSSLVVFEPDEDGIYTNEYDEGVVWCFAEGLGNCLIVNSAVYEGNIILVFNFYGMI